MIIEFYGLPGSGKSYVIGQLRGNLHTKEGPMNSFKRFCLSCVKKIVIWTPESILLRWKINRLLKNQQDNPAFINRKKHEYIDNLVMLAFVYRWAGRRIIYMDEGIVHRVVAFAVNYNLSIGQMESILETLEKYIERAHVFFLDVEIEECLHSIKSRNRHQAEMDEFNDETLKDFLQCYMKYFRAINSRHDFIHITRNHLEPIKKMI